MKHAFLNRISRIYEQLFDSFKRIITPKRGIRLKQQRRTSFFFMGAVTNPLISPPFLLMDMKANRRLTGRSQFIFQLKFEWCSIEPVLCKSVQSLQAVDFQSVFYFRSENSFLQIESKIAISLRLVNTQWEICTTGCWTLCIARDLKSSPTGKNVAWKFDFPGKIYTWGFGSCHRIWTREISAFRRPIPGPIAKSRGWICAYI